MSGIDLNRDPEPSQLAHRQLRTSLAEAGRQAGEALAEQRSLVQPLVGEEKPVWPEEGLACRSAVPDV